MDNMRHGIAIAWMMAVMLFFGAPPVLADGLPVTIELRVIYADRSDKGVDENAKDVHEKLAKLFDYTHYRLEALSSQSAYAGASATFKLPDGREVMLSPSGIDPDGRIRIELLIPGLVKTDFRLKNGGSLILGGPQYKDGVLILMISVAIH
jgi:hypothetical protein